MSEPTWITTKKAFAEQDRGEFFSQTALDEKILLPVTRAGFENLVSEVAAVYQLPVDDEARMLVAGFVHHIGRETCTTTLGTLASALRKQAANFVTSMVCEEISLRKQAETETAQTQLSVVKSTDETSA